MVVTRDKEQTWPAGDLGGISIHKGPRSERGSCNFCSRDCYNEVYELAGERTVVRLCPQCFDVVYMFGELERG